MHFSISYSIILNNLYETTKTNLKTGLENFYEKIEPQHLVAAALIGTALIAGAVAYRALSQPKVEESKQVVLPGLTLTLDPNRFEIKLNNQFGRLIKDLLLLLVMLNQRSYNYPQPVFFILPTSYHTLHN